jgi:hypothetical protein
MAKCSKGYDIDCEGSCAYWFSGIGIRQRQIRGLDMTTRNDPTAAQLALWQRLAAQDNLADEYNYHLSMICPPLPYGMWKMKFKALEAIQNAPDYLDTTQSMDYELKLCNDLGY